ncbi:exchange protein directly activated by cAMP [Lycorma delicatula]|uniref:exchange protein directly activated by cAMP n=1 Tax=Lycorma delicatula TaxID=130591 RepID=UPI003F50DDE6
MARLLGLGTVITTTTTTTGGSTTTKCHPAAPASPPTNKCQSPPSPPNSNKSGVGGGGGGGQSPPPPLISNNTGGGSGGSGKRTQSPDIPNPADPITESPSVAMARAGWVLRTLLLNDMSGVLRDRKSSGGRMIVRRCASGSELIDWLLNLAPQIESRQQAIGMWQALLEEGVISHATMDHPFKDKCLLYNFWQDREGSTSVPTAQDIAEAEEHLEESICELIHRSPDALLRMILRKPSHDRTAEELETIYEELMQLKPLAHFSNSVKRELASVVVFEAHNNKAGSILFQQGDEGRSWYIILKGSVDVVTHSKGNVDIISEGEDFGKLALINDAPRAATIILREDICHFLRVDKDNFNRIMRDVEANTVTFKEHGKDVLVLERITGNNLSQPKLCRFLVVAGTPQKMLEHLLETRVMIGSASSGREPINDPCLDDFFLTHIVYMPTRQLVTELNKHYHVERTKHDQEYILSSKRRVIQFVYRWVLTVRHPVFDDAHTQNFLEELASEVESDCLEWNSLYEEANLMHHVTSRLRRHQEDKNATAGQKWKLPPCGQPISLFAAPPNGRPRTVIRPADDVIFRVYCADHTYCTLRFPVSATAETIKINAADKLGLKYPREELVLVELKSTGERITFRDSEVGIPTALSINGRLFVSPRDHLDALTLIAEQENPTEGIEFDAENFSSKELAYHMTQFDWDLFWTIHEYELVYHTFGRHRFNQMTANLDVFLRRFNEIQYWVATELCLTQSLSKRVQVLRKLIKLALYCKEYQNLNAFFAIVMGLSNVAVSRLSLTWEKLPSKSRKLFTELEALIDPSKNHRAYRQYVSKLHSPIIPFMPLLLKDMTFTHEGNKTTTDGLINFEKMHMIAQTMRSLRYCRSRHMVLEPPSPKNEAEIRSYVTCLRTIDNQRTLTALSQKLEPRRS